MKWEKERMEAEVWCTGCDRWTFRDRLPGTSTTFGLIPDFYFCVFCGVWDADYIKETGLGETA